MPRSVKTVKSSILLKVICLFLAVLTPIYMIGMSIYYWGYDMVRKEISHSSLSQVNLYGNMLEQEILRIQQMQYECINDPDLLYLVNTFEILDSYERSQYMLRVQNRLHIMYNSTLFIDTILVHIPSINKTISADGVLSLSDHWEDALSDISNASSSGIIYKESGMYLNTKFPYIPWSTRTPRCIMEIKLSDQAIKNMLDGFNQYPDSEIFLAAPDQDYYLSNKNSEVFPHEILSKLDRSSSDSIHLELEGKHMETTFVSLESVGMKLISIVPTDYIYSKIQSYRYTFFSYTLVSLVVILIFALSVRRMISKPVKTLIQSFKRLKSGDFSARVTYEKQDEFQYLYSSYNDMTAHLQELIDQVYEQKILAQRSELKQLQSQINPHFLYNSFFNIYRMAKDEDFENISAFSQYLGNFYQYITRDSADWVPLLKEVEHAQAYLNIQSMRFHNRLNVDIEKLPASYTSFLVPRLMLQPIMENAFEHGLKHVEDPVLTIRYHLLQNELQIVIQDNGIGMNEDAYKQLMDKLGSDDKMIETTAMINIHRRLKIKFGDSSGITVIRNKTRGLKVTIHITCLGGDYHVSNVNCG